MADTLDITEGTGTTIATQDEGGVHYQEVKLVASGTGTTEALSKAEDSGHSSGNHGIMALTVRQNTAASLSGTDADYQPLITDTNGRLHVLDQNSAAILTALQIIDDWDDSDKCNVNINVAGTDVAANAGVLNAQTLRVTIATDDECNNYLGTIDADTGAIKTAVEALDNAVDGNYLNCNLNIAGTDVSANAGTLTAQTLRVTIATDDECNNFLGTIDADTGNIVTAVQLIDDAIYADDADWSDGSSKHMLVGGLYQSTPQTITDGDVGPLEVNATGSLRVTDANITACNTGAVVISSGTVTTVSTVTNLAQLGGTAITMDEGVHDAGCQRVTIATDDDSVAHLNNIVTALQIIDDWDDANYCNVNLNLAGTDAGVGEGALDGSELRVTIATDDDGVAHLATIAGDTTNIETAIQIIDDWDAVHDSAASSDGPQLMAAYDATKPSAVADGDAVRVLADEYGRLLSGVEKTAWQEDYDSADASGEGEAVKASAASTIVVVQSYVISVDAEMWVKLQEEDSSALTGKFWLKAGGGVAITLPDKAPLILGTDSDLEVITEGAGNISVSATGYTIPG